MFRHGQVSTASASEAHTLTRCLAITLNEVRLAILRDEEADMRVQGVFVDGTPGQFLSLGLEIESLQYVACAVTIRLPY